MEHEEQAERMERDAEKMEEHSEQLGERIEETRPTGSARSRTPSVPGARARPGR